ncbi:MAG: ABC transporter permease [Acidimicrobiales bacterium]
MPERSDTDIGAQLHPAEFGSASPGALFQEVGAEIQVEAVLAPPPGKKRGLGVAFWLSVTWIAFVIILAILAPVLPIHPPNKVFVGPPNTSPGAKYLLGTDELGRDMLSRIIWGARVSMVVGFTSIGIGLLIGGTLGIIAGYFRGRLGAFIMGCMDVLLAFPTLILGLAIITFMGQSLRNVVIALGIISIAPISRIIRASTLTFSEREFVSASRSLGARNFRIVTREILPNVALPTFSFALVAVAIAIVAEGALAFLGLSVKAPTASWGGMINEGRSLMALHPYLSLIPAAVMFLTVLAFNFAGDSLRSFFDVRESAL